MEAPKARRAPSNFNEDNQQVDHVEHITKVSEEMAHGNGLEMAENGENGLEMAENDPFLNEDGPRPSRAPISTNTAF